MDCRKGRTVPLYFSYKYLRKILQDRPVSVYLPLKSAGRSLRSVRIRSRTQYVRYFPVPRATREELIFLRFPLKEVRRLELTFLPHVTSFMPRGSPYIFRGSAQLRYKRPWLCLLSRRCTRPSSPKGIPNQSVVPAHPRSLCLDTITPDTFCATDGGSFVHFR